MKNLVFIISSIIFFQFCSSRTDNIKDRLNCYQEKIKWNTFDRNFKDSILLFRNYIENKKDKRVICNSISYKKDIENLIWNSKYISILIQYMGKMNNFAFISYNQVNKDEFIVSFYLCNNESKETCEMRRFKIRENMIIGINVFPNIVKDFIPIDEYENKQLDKID